VGVGVGVVGLAMGGDGHAVCRLDCWGTEPCVSGECLSPFFFSMNVSKDKG
jgi:hypothetical protein